MYDALGITELAQKARQKGVDLALKNLKYNPNDTRAMYMSANALIGLEDHERGIGIIGKCIEY